MGLVATDKGGSFNPAPAGTHLAVCCQVIDLGHQFSKFYNKVSHKVLIGWELPEEINDEQEGGPKPFLVWNRYTLSLSKNAALRGHLEAWRGRQFSGDELKGFDLKNIIGKACMLNVAHEENEGNTYVRVKAVMALPKGQHVKEPVHDKIFFDLGAFDQKVFDKFSENLQKTINASEERTGKRHEVENGPPNGEPPADENIPF